MLAPKARGELSDALTTALRTDTNSWTGPLGAEPSDADDLQLALWIMYELHYGGFDDVDEEWEWHPALLEIRRGLEARFEDDLRERCTVPAMAEPFSDALFDFIENYETESIASYVQRQATREQVSELLRVRSIYHLKESDPTTWVVPRLPAGPKAPLMELQYDEYGGGQPTRLHAHLFARGMESCGLRSEYGAYIDEAPLEILEQNNAWSLFGLHRRLRGAALGHLAAFETTSSLPSRRMAQGLARLGLPDEMVGYYEEHVEADSVHEQLATRAVCGALVAEEPSQAHDVVFGASTCMTLEDRFARRMLAVWDR